jgi:uncharacterized repeat protein (TIGR01451 family)
MPTSPATSSKRNRVARQRVTRQGGSRQYFEFLEQRQMLSVVPVQTFYLPVPAADVATALKTIHSDAKTPISTFTSISVAKDNTQIFYDQWENGFVRDIANPAADEIYDAATNPAGVQIWGDGDPSNGAAPGFPGDVLHSGDVIMLNSPAIPVPRNPSQIFFDGGDKIAATKSIAVGQLNYASNTVTLLAGALQVNPTSDWGTMYKVPIGQNTTSSSSMFKYTGLAIMAAKDGTTVQIDTDGNGVVDKTVTLNQGQAYLVNNGIKQGATVSSTDPDKPIQVNIITGNPGQTYASRWFTLAPVDRWSHSYYTPVSTRSSTPTVVFLYNPSAVAINVTETTRGSSGNAATLTTTTIKVPAKGTAKVVLPDGSGAHFETAGGEPFYAVSTSDYAKYNYDWGMSLISENELTTQAIVGLGFGRDPLSKVAPTQNGSPVWVTPTGNGNTAETVYVDFNGDNQGAFTDPNGYHYDLALSLKELQRAKVFDPDGDQSAMLLYTLNPNVKLAVSWGEDPSSASVAEPGIDAGTNIVPLPEFDAGKTAALAVDANGDGVVSPGDTLRYTIVVNNASRTPLVAMNLKDLLPATLSYVPGTLSYTLTPHAGTPSAAVGFEDDGATAFALDDAGMTLPTLEGGAVFTVTFEAKIGDVLPANLTDLINTGIVYSPSLDESVPLEAHTHVDYDVQGLVFLDANRNGSVDGGEPGLAGVTVNLLQGTTVVATATTDATGHYLFIAPPLGNYTVDVVDSTVLAIVPSSELTAGVDPSALALVGGTALTHAGIDGYMTKISAIPSHLSGRVTVGGVGIPGVAMTLTGSDANGPIAPITVLTAADGTYAFPAVMTGTYTITEAQPDGYLDGADAAGTYGGTVAAVPGDAISNIQLPGDANGINYDFTEVTPAGLAGVVFADTNNNGVRDAGELPIAGAQVTLTGTNDLGAIVPVTVSAGDDGSYAFTNLRPGTYTITETQPAGYLDGKDSMGTLGGTPGNDVFGAINVSAEAAGTGYNFAEILPSTVSGFVYLDTNNNGAKDVGETGIGGVQVTLTGTNDLGAIVPIVVTTAADGSYGFGSLRPGTYAVNEAQAAGYLDGLDAKSGVVIAGSKTTDVASNVVLGTGANATAIFGELAPASVTGFVYADGNNNGIKDAAETGIAGVQLTLTGTSDLGATAPITVTTAANGSYAFGTLRPGTYVVTETQPAGTIDGLDSKNGVVIAGSNATDAITGITLGSGGTTAGNNFGELVAGKICGFVYADGNNNGLKEAGELGLAGMQVTLTGTNDLGAAVAMTTTTGTDGSYSFTALRPGTYAVTEAQPAGMLDGLDAKGGIVVAGSNITDALTGIAIASGTTAAANNFGELSPAKAGGIVFLDANNDGVKDAAEAGIGGVQLTLTGSNDLGAIVPIVITTAADGSYTFNNLRPGTYTIAEAQPAGYLDGKDAKGGVVIGGSSITDIISNVTLAVGAATTGNTFGELRPATISGFAYVDTNGNGQKDAGETGLGGVQMTLTGTNDLGAVGPVSVTTAADGSYTFGNLRPGTYAVNEAQPANILDGLDAKAGAVIAGSNLSDVVSGITLVSGSSATALFGEQLPATVTGFVYADANNNGIMDGGETGIAGVKLVLTGVNDMGAIAPISIASGADGSYNFGILRPGTYAVAEIQPSGYLDGLDAKAGAVVAGSNASDAIAGIVLTSGPSGNNNFGELLPACVKGIVFVDSNNNGIVDAGEAPLAGVKVTLTGSNDLGAIAAVSTTTAADGSYSFGTLRPGTYAVTETQPGGYIDGKDAKSGVVIAGSNATDAIANIVLSSGTSAANNTFGELQAASLSGFVYMDTNNNGLKEAGEAGIGGAQVTLTGTDDRGAITAITVTTAADGSYTFGNLRPGTYTITEVQPANTFDGKDALGSLSGTLGNDVISAIPVTSNAAGTNYNFGEQLAGSISGIKFQDMAGNGASADDKPLAGVTIKLYRDDGDHVRDAGDTLVTSTVTASGTGAYAFSNLPKAFYFVEEVVPTGWVRTGPTTVGYYAADLTGTTSTITGDNFTNFKICNCKDDISCMYFIINGCTTVSTLAGNVHQGDTVRAVFTLTETETFSLVSYTAPDPTFVAEHSQQQVIFDSDTATYGPGTHSLTVVVPNSYFQIDFVCGTPLTILGPAGSNIYYTPQGRLISSDNGGTTVPTQLGALTGTGSIAGGIYVDANNNGKKDSGEAGIAGAKITLTGVTSTGERVKVTLTTDAYGNFKFTGLKAGAYKLSEGSLEGRRDGRDTAGSKGGNVTNDVISNITIGSGIAATGYLFGELS